MTPKFNIAHGLMAVSRDGEVLHFCGYEQPPTAADMAGLIEELKTDKTFGLTEVEFAVVHAPREVIDHYKEAYEQP